MDNSFELMGVIRIINLITIIVPVYNSEKYLSKCIEGIISQTYTNLQIILVNDGSTDRSLEICNSYREKDPRIIVIDSKNSGVAAARNKGLEIANGDYIGFVDSDDLIDWTMYEKLLNSIIREQADIAECGYLKMQEEEIIDGDIQIQDRVIEGTENILEIYLSQCSMTNFNCNKLYRKSTIGNLRYDDLKYSEDFLFNVMAIMNSNKYVAISDPMYYYIQHSSSATGVNFTLSKNDQILAAERAKALIEESFPILSNKVNYYILDRIIIITRDLYNFKGNDFDEYYTMLKIKFRRTYKKMLKHYIKDHKLSKLFMHFFYALDLKKGLSVSSLYLLNRKKMKKLYLIVRRNYEKSRNSNP